MQFSLTKICSTSSMVMAIGITILPKITVIFAVLLGQNIRNWWSHQTPEQKRIFKERANSRCAEMWCTGAAGLGLFAGFLWGHTETDPATGRRQLFLFSESSMTELANHDVNIMLMDFREREMLLNATHPGYARVDGLMGKLLNANQNVNAIRNQRWTVVVVDKPIINAFAMPNGHVFVYTGLMEFANDDQLTIILGHELAHCTLRHSNQKRSVKFVAEVMHLALVFAVWTAWPIHRAVFAHIISAFIKQTCLILPHSRAKEHEADREGLMLAAKTCIDVTEGYNYRTKRDKSNVEKSNKLWFMSTHPTYKSRIQHLYSLIPEAKNLQKCAENAEKSPE